MHENIEQLFNYLHGIWRYRWYAIIVAWIVAPIGWGIVKSMPNLYESNAKIYVDTDSILKPLLRGLAVDSMDLSERLGMMTKALLSRPNLEKVIRDLDLDVKVNTKQEYENLLKNLEQNVQIESSRTHRSIHPEPPNLFTISARNSDPQLTYRIVNSLLNIFLENSLGGNRQSNDMAEQFIERQIIEYEARLSAAEKRLLEFKRKNIGVLPEQGGSYFQRLEAAQTSLDALELELKEEQNRKAELLRQLNSVNPNQRIISSSGSPVLSPLEQRINNLQSRLDDLLLKYTEQHPDVIEARSVLEQLKEEQNKQYNQTIQNESQESAHTTQNPMYQQIKIALGEVDANIAALKVREREYKSRVEQLKEQMEVLPKVEAELKALNRDYEINKSNYDTLITRREQAKIGKQAEKTGEEVELKILEPPRVPISPIAPNRPLLSVMVLFAAFAVGLGLAFLLSQLKPSFYNLRMIRSHIDYPIFGSISMLDLTETVRRRRLKLVAFFLANGLLFVAFVTVVITSMKQ